MEGRYCQVTMKLVVCRVRRPFKIGTKALQTSLQDHGENSRKMGLRNTSNVICDGPGNPFRVSDESCSKVTPRLHGSPRFVDKGSHVSTIVIHVIETLVVVVPRLNGRRKYVCLCKETRHCSDNTLECPLQFFLVAQFFSSRPSVQCMLPNNYSFVPYLGSDWFSPS